VGGEHAAGRRRRRRPPRARFRFSCVGNETTSARHARPTGARRHQAARSSSTTPRSGPLPRALRRGTGEGRRFLDARLRRSGGRRNGVLTVMVGGDARSSKGEAGHRRLCAWSADGPAGSGQLTKMVNQICMPGSSKASPKASISPSEPPRRRAVVGSSPRRRSLADGEPLQEHEAASSTSASPSTGCARTSRSPRRGSAERRQAAPRRPRHQFYARSGDGRQALGYVEPDRAAGAGLIDGEVRSSAFLPGHPSGVVSPRNLGGDVRCSRERSYATIPAADLDAHPVVRGEARPQAKQRIEAA